jgi:DNA-directed RNA polymerase subunit F
MFETYATSSDLDYLYETMIPLKDTEDTEHLLTELTSKSHSPFNFGVTPAFEKNPAKEPVIHRARWYLMPREECEMDHKIIRWLILSFHIAYRHIIETPADNTKTDRVKTLTCYLWHFSKDIDKTSKLFEKLCLNGKLPLSFYMSIHDTIPTLTQDEIRSLFSKESVPGDSGEVTTSAQGGAASAASGTSISSPHLPVAFTTTLLTPPEEWAASASEPPTQTLTLDDSLLRVLDLLDSSMLEPSTTRYEQ